VIASASDKPARQNSPMSIDQFPAVHLEVGYENVVAACPRCTTRNVYNRAEDIGSFRAITNRRVSCAACQAEFEICGDLVNPAFETLLLDSCDFLREKRHMQAVLSATTAYELFFSHVLRVELVYRPSRRDHVTERDDIAWLEATATSLRDKTARCTFAPMRRIFLRLAIDGTRPATLSDAEACIANIQAKPPVLDRAEIEQRTDDPFRKLLLAVHDATIADLRNNIVHKTAYRPALSETKAAVDDAYHTIFGLSHHFGLQSDDYHLNEPPDQL